MDILVSRSTSMLMCRAEVSLNMRRKKATNLYQVLSLDSENVGFDEIRKAYRSMARRYHPDVLPPLKKEEATRFFVELHRAYETLSNPSLREMHDNELRMNERESEFSRERWQAQLCELRRRSERRERVRRGPRD
ncbi:hypothetical protein J5N97_017062 [Dioscorea zingiberensis]|uniref:J domain-containing protein n=1 Tax=Dioscorea zingiberensis TaxID=325984 RepID=A0A9D5CL79_9LILI|nr:hypothetical protein J5N97_017062 [Dioscorea zingiberensis]